MEDGRFCKLKKDPLPTMDEDSCLKELVNSREDAVKEESL